MTRILKWCAIAAMLISLNSCGLPVALARSAGSVLNGVGSLADAAGGLGGAF
jgi:hypothetical protein